MTDLLDGLLDDLTAEGDQLWSDRRRPRRRRLADARRRPPAGPSPPRSRTCSGPTRSPSSPRTARATDKEAWDDVVLAAIDDPIGYVDAAASSSPRLPRAEALLARWGAAATALRSALAAGCPTGEKMPWFGPPMSPASMATARFMETWAHALDVYDALGERPEPTDRIRHVAHLGVRTRNFAFSVHELEPPAEEFRVELAAPSRRARGRGVRRTPRRR